uniref:UPAR/Ly6 domain-containing protein n=1 Tax=Ciona savignyi TaxID=51511 RepID=H2ZB50_CIOSA
MKVLIVLLTFFACSSIVVGFSCYQNFTATSMIWNRKFYSISSCPSSSTEQACVKMTGTLNTLLGPGEVVYGQCVNATTCSQLTCANYDATVRRLNPFFRLASCNVSCCYTSNCNSDSLTTPQPLSSTPYPNTQEIRNATSPVTYRSPPLPVSGTDAIPPSVVETTPQMPPLPTTNTTAEQNPQATSSDNAVINSTSQAVGIKQEMTTSGSRDVRSSAQILVLILGLAIGTIF